VIRTTSSSANVGTVPRNEISYEDRKEAVEN
jgi:hypothetical protein